MVIYRLCAWFGKSFVEHVCCNTKRYHGLVAGTKVFRGCLAGAATHVRMQAWAESVLRGLHCLQPGTTCSFQHSIGCSRHESCGLQSWCDDTHGCQPCSRWDPGDLSSSVTASAPLSCTGPDFRPDPCWLLRSRGCPCSHHGCFRAVDCQASYLCKRGQHRFGTRPRRVAIVTSLCHEPDVERQLRGPRDHAYARNAHFLTLLLRSLAHVRTKLPIYAMVCGRRDNRTEVHLPAALHA